MKNSTSTNQPVIVVVGETASGKSAIGMEIAQRFGGEIIAADSRTVYTGMDIGTAKPTLADQAEVPHHVLDVVEPGEHFSAAQFQEMANTAIDTIRRRGRLPVMVGGTSLYVDAVVFDYSFNQKGDTELRSRLSKLSREELQEKATELGIETTNEILKNKRYLIRLIETRGEKNNDRSQIRDDVFIVGIKLPRNVLRKRIEQRVEIMFRQGLRTEVDRLVQKYGWESEALTGIGYREFRDFYDKKISMSQVKRNIVQNTLKNLAKPQRTWNKRNPHIHWFESHEAAVECVADFLKKHSVASQSQGH